MAAHSIPAPRSRIDVAKGATSCGGVTDNDPDPANGRQPSTNRKSVILTDSSELALGERRRARSAASSTSSPPAPRSPASPASEPTCSSTWRSDTRVQALKTQAANNPGCPYAQNLVAQEIKAIIDSYRANPLRYVVIVGGDDVIPFFRYPDQSLLGQESGYVPPVRSDSASEASLRKDFVLSQDAYGARPWSPCARATSRSRASPSAG